MGEKYRRGDESFDQWLDRISNGHEEVKQLIIDKKFYLVVVFFLTEM